MKRFLYCILIAASTALQTHVNAQAEIQNMPLVTFDKVQALKDTLLSLSKSSKDSLFINHCISFSYILASRGVPTKFDSSVLSITYDTLCKKNSNADPRKFKTYLDRMRSLVVAWQSPTDNKASFALVKLPKNWNPEKAYPIYIYLHGFWNVAENPIDYMTYGFRTGSSNSFAFEDGYQISPWGRGNFFYEGISETDIWECKAEVERLFKIDLRRQYIAGHSMGGYGAWYIANRSPKVWAAMGVHAGALSYSSEKLVNFDVAENLKNIPTYFVCGNNDGLMDVNTRAYTLLLGIGNENTTFVTFNGGHEHLQNNVENLYLWIRDFENNNYTKIKKKELSEKNLISFYPNPINGKALVKIKTENSALIKLSIINIEGKQRHIIENKIVSSGTHLFEIDKESLKGIYILQLEKDGKIVENKKIMFY